MVNEVGGFLAPRTFKGSNVLLKGTDDQSDTKSREHSVASGVSARSRVRSVSRGLGANFKVTNFSAILSPENAQKFKNNRE